MNEPDGLVSPRFIDTHGQLPLLWPRRVIFFANLLALFFGNEEQTRVLSKEVGELDSYSGRLIPILNLLFAGTDNVLVVERLPDPALSQYMIDQLGLSLPRICLLPHHEYTRLGDLLAEHPETPLNELLPQGHPLITAAKGVESETWLDGYVTDDVLPRIAERLGCRTLSTTRASHMGNNKVLLYQYLQQQGLPTIATELASRPSDIAGCAARLREQGYDSAVVRSAIGASGVGMLKLPNVDDENSLNSIPEYFFHEGPALVQGWLQPGRLNVTRVRSPSTQLFLDDEHVYAFDMTEQILSEHNIHEGNESPPPYLAAQPELRVETMRQAKFVGTWLHQTGYRGTASIDWLVVERTGTDTAEVYVCEVNARVTGATYPSLLAKHFHPSGAWLLRNLRLSHPVAASTLIQIFDSRNHLYHLGRRAGILPLNFNFGKDGLVHKGQFICIGRDSQQCHHFLNLAEHDLPGGWTTDRD
jgi:hypothetical protein